jgi:hypothetical protein
VTLFDGVIGPGWSWSQRGEAMARRLLAGSPLRCPRGGGGGQCPHPGQSHGPGRPAGRLAGPAAAGPPGRSESATAADVPGIPGHADLPAGPARTGRPGCTRTPGSSFWTCPWPRTRLCPSGRGHHHRPCANHPKCMQMSESGSRAGLRAYARSLAGLQLIWTIGPRTGPGELARVGPDRLLRTVRVPGRPLLGR